MTSLLLPCGLADKLAEVLMSHLLAMPPNVVASAVAIVLRDPVVVDKELPLAVDGRLRQHEQRTLLECYLLCPCLIELHQARAQTMRSLHHRAA
eukprot:7814250-Pyramimonas_sp.AAC.1